MKTLPVQARLYWISVLLVACCVYGLLLLVCPFKTELQTVLTLMALTGAAICAEVFPIRMPRGAELTVSTAIYFAAILILPPAGALIPSTVAMASLRFTQRQSLFKVVFNISQYTLAVGLASIGYHLLGGRSIDEQQIFQIDLLIPLCVAAIIYLILNAGIVFGMVALMQRLPFRYVLFSTRTIMPQILGMLCVGVLLASEWGSLKMAFFIPPLIAIYLSIMSSTRLVDETTAALADIATIVDTRDPNTYDHSLRVAEYTERIAIRLGLSSEDVEFFKLCGRLHDIGKIGITDALLFKPGALSEDEKAEFNRHAMIGANLLRNFQLFRKGVNIVAAHHERYDGRGYPNRLQGDAIPLGARIIAVADSFDAMTSNRPYRSGMSKEQAMDILRQGAGTQWDPSIISVFLDLLSAEVNPVAESYAETPLSPSTTQPVPNRG